MNFKKSVNFAEHHSQPAKARLAIAISDVPSTLIKSESAMNMSQIPKRLSMSKREEMKIVYLF